MSKAYSGIYGIVQSGGTDVDVEGFSCEVSAVSIDVTTTADAGWDDYIAGNRAVSGSFDFNINMDKNPFGVLLGLTPGNDPGPTLKLFVSPTDYLTGVAFIEKLSIKSTRKDAIKGTCSFKNKGAWTLPA